MKALRSLSFVFGAALAFALQLSSAHAAIKTQYVDYKHGDTALSGYLAKCLYGK